jgi:beta-1,4-mannosyltransferase
MFGSGVPVCAVDFPALSELVQHNGNGMIFQNTQELEEQLIHLLFPSFTNVISW